MSMFTYGVDTQAMVLTINEFQVLLSLNKDSIKNKFILDNSMIEFLDTIDDIDFTDIVDFAYNIDFATFIGEFSGYIDCDSRERIYFNDDDIIILELKKNNLYDKYKDKTDIINELKDTLKNVGIVVTDEYINNHFGLVCGSYLA